MSHSLTARVASAENEDWAEFGRPGSKRLVVDMELGNLTVLRVNSPKDRGHAPLPHLNYGSNAPVSGFTSYFPFGVAHELRMAGGGH